MFDIPYTLFLVIGGAFCGIAGLLGASCAITKRAVLAAALQGALFGTCVALGIDWLLSTRGSGLAIGVGGIIATLRMTIIVPICNIALKLLYDVLFTFIHKQK